MNSDGISPELLLRAYANGYFPMAETAEDDDLFWFDPPVRGILPLETFHVPKRLRREIRRGRFEVRCDTAFRKVIEGCAEPAPDRPKTWINGRIVELYCTLADRGFAHSVECWCDGKLVGGLYGVSLRAAFFGESMFSRAADASKVALVHLVALLRDGGYRLLDTQFTTDHLARFGAVDVPQPRYKTMLSAALSADAVWSPDRLDGAVARLLSAA